MTEVFIPQKMNLGDVNGRKINKVPLKTKIKLLAQHISEDYGKKKIYIYTYILSVIFHFRGSFQAAVHLFSER